MQLFLSMKFLCFLLFVITCSFGQQKSLNQLELEVGQYNDLLKYQSSIQLLSNFIASDDISDYDRYYAYLLKSYTYKRVFNYELVLHNLDLALHEGLKSDKKQLVEQTIKAQKAFCYFDTQQYDKAKMLMTALEKSNYAFLDLQDKSFIIMQQGYLLMKKNDYGSAEIKLDTAIAITKRCYPRNLPNIYGKKVELYNEMKLYKKRDVAFEEGMKYAKHYKVIKYELYLYQVLKKCLQYNKDYIKAFEIDQKIDSISQIYNADSYNGKIALLENKLKNERQLLEDRRQATITVFMSILISMLVILIVVLVKLYFVTKQKKQILEKENKKIQEKLAQLLNEVDESGSYSFDYSQYKLSERQKEIIQLIREGKSNKYIAIQLNISEHTVKFHVKNIYKILNIRCRDDLKNTN